MVSKSASIRPASPREFPQVVRLAHDEAIGPVLRHRLNNIAPRPCLLPLRRYAPLRDCFVQQARAAPGTIDYSPSISASRVMNGSSVMSRRNGVTAIRLSASAERSV